jgi:hypothetical protein
MTETRRDLGRYRKTATITAEQIPPGEVRNIDTLEGPATAAHPSYQVWANTKRGESWPIAEEFFLSEDTGFDETGEVIGGRKVYRKKPTVWVYAYQVDTDDHDPVVMRNMNEPFSPPRGYWVIVKPDGRTIQGCVEAEVFANDFEPIAG